MTRTFVQEIDLDTGVVLSERHLLDGKLHRSAKEGPAVILREPDGSLAGEGYWLNGVRHSEIGPAIVLYEGHQVSYRQWFHNGTVYDNPEGDKAWLAALGRELTETYAPILAHALPRPAKSRMPAP